MVDYNQLAASCDKELERSALCEILVTRHLVADFKMHFFTGPEYRLFEDILDQWLSFRQIDVDLLKKDHGETIEACLNSLSASATKPLIEQLRAEYVKRSRGKMILESLAIDDHEKALKEMSGEINNILHSKSMKEYNHLEEVTSLLSALEAEATRGKEIAGYSTGLVELDKIMNGIQLGNFYIIGGLKKTGKSRFMVHLAVQLASQGVFSFVNSLEMSPLQLNLCALSAYAGIDAKRFGHALDEQMRETLKRSADALHSMSWQIYRDYTISDLWARADQLKTKMGINILFVDFLQRLRDERYRGDRVREVENISQELANMSRELNIAVIALSQLRGEAERLPKDEVPSMGYLKESHGIGENMDCLIMLHNPDRHDSPFTPEGAYKIQNFKIMVEQRYGISGATIECDADLRCCSFCDKSGY